MKGLIRKMNKLTKILLIICVIILFLLLFFSVIFSLVNIPNEKILNNRYQNYYELAKNKYLSVEEQEILLAAEEIITDENSIKNDIYTSIKSSYDYIKNQLFTFYELNADEYEEYNDDAELMLLYIEELRNTIISYQASDYRRVLATI